MEFKLCLVEIIGIKMDREKALKILYGLLISYVVCAVVMAIAGLTGLLFFVASVPVVFNVFILKNNERFSDVIFWTIYTISVLVILIPIVSVIVLNTYLIKNAL